MTYTKPFVVAQNNATGSFAMGCPEKSRGGGLCWEACEIRK